MVAVDPASSLLAVPGVDEGEMLPSRFPLLLEAPVSVLDLEAVLPVSVVVSPLGVWIRTFLCPFAAFTTLERILLDFRDLSDRLLLCFFNFGLGLPPFLNFCMMEGFIVSGIMAR